MLMSLTGYLNNENATKSAINEDGWLKTGDFAYFDQDGYLHVLDRLKDTIKYNGFQVKYTELKLYPLKNEIIKQIIRLVQVLLVFCLRCR